MKPFLSLLVALFLLASSVARADGGYSDPLEFGWECLVVPVLALAVLVFLLRRAARRQGRSS